MTRNITDLILIALLASTAFFGIIWLFGTSESLTYTILSKPLGILSLILSNRIYDLLRRRYSRRKA